MADRDQKEDLFHDYYHKKELSKLESRTEAELQLETNGESKAEASSEGETDGRDVAKATIILEEATEPSESVGPEDKFEEVEAASRAEADAVPESRWRLKKYQRAIGALLVAICVSFVVYGLRWLVISRQGNDHKINFAQVYRAPIQKRTTDILSFAGFLVQLPEEDDQTYLFLSISVKGSNSNVYKEISEKRSFCRGAIYAALVKAVKTTNKRRTSKKKLRRHIMDALNGILATGTVDAIYFTEFLAV